MAAKIHGRLGAPALAANNDTTLYQVPAGRKATVSVRFCNRSATDTTVRLAHVDGAIGALVTDDYMIYDASLPGNGFISDERITISAGHSLIVRAGSANVSAVCFGVEEDA
jgi:hypothetical protein